MHMFDWIFFAIVIPIPGILLLDLFCTHVAHLDLIHRAAKAVGEIKDE